MNSENQAEMPWPPMAPVPPEAADRTQYIQQFRNELQKAKLQTEQLRKQNLALVQANMAQILENGLQSLNTPDLQNPIAMPQAKTKKAVAAPVDYGQQSVQYTDALMTQMLSNMNEKSSQGLANSLPTPAEAEKKATNAVVKSQGPNIPYQDQTPYEVDIRMGQAAYGKMPQEASEVGPGKVNL